MDKQTKQIRTEPESIVVVRSKPDEAVLVAWK